TFAPATGWPASSTTTPATSTVRTSANAPKSWALPAATGIASVECWLNGLVENFTTAYPSAPVGLSCTIPAGTSRSIFPSASAFASVIGIESFGPRVIVAESFAPATPRPVFESTSRAVIRAAGSSAVVTSAVALGFTVTGATGSGKTGAGPVYAKLIRYSPGGSSGSVSGAP